jgi:hypothetical protein
MADIPPLPPGLLSAIQSGRPITPEDIYSGGASIGPQSASPYLPIDASALAGPAVPTSSNAGVHSAAQAGGADVDVARGYAGGAVSQFGPGFQQIAGGQMLINAAQFAGIQRQKLADQTAIARWGVDSIHPSELYTSIASETQTDQAEIMRLRQDINDKLSVGITDNPIQWLINQISVPFDLDKVHNLEARQEHDFAVIAKLRDNASAEVALNASTAYSADSIRLAGMDAIAAGTARVQAAQSQTGAATAIANIGATGTSIASTSYAAEVQADRVNADFNKERYDRLIRNDNLRREQAAFEVQYAVSRLNLAHLPVEQSIKEQELILRKQAASLDAQRLELQKAGDARAIQELDIRKQQLDLQLREYDQMSRIRDEQMKTLQYRNFQEAGQRQSTELLDGKVRQLSGVLGVDLPNYDAFIKMQDGPLKQLFNQLLTSTTTGDNFAWSNVGTAQAINLLNNSRVTLPAGQELLRQELTRMYMAKLTSLGPTAKTFTPDQLMEVLNKSIKTDVQSQLNGITDKGSIYSLPSLNTTISLPGIQGTQLAGLLATIGRNADGSPNQTYETKASDVVNVLQNEINAGRLTAPQAADMVTNFYKTASTWLAATKAYNRMAVPSPLEVNSYKAFVPAVSNIFGGVNVLNMLNKPEVENYFVRRIIGEQPTMGTGYGVLP